MSAILAELTEKEWAAQVVQLATLLGWSRYHTYRSTKSASGWPDEALVRDRLILVELKREDGKLSTTQIEWLDKLASAGCETYLWRPGDLDEIATILGKRWKFETTLDGRRLLRSELTSYAPQSLWVAGVGRVDEGSQPSFDAKSHGNRLGFPSDPLERG